MHLTTRATSRNPITVKSPQRSAKTPEKNPLASEAGRLLARMRDPKKMRRGDSAFYRALAMKRRERKDANQSDNYAP